MENIDTEYLFLFHSVNLFKDRFYLSKIAKSKLVDYDVS